MRNLLIAMCSIWLAGAVSAQEMTAVAVSPDGATILAAGDNRAVYTLDATSLEVTRRRYIAGQVEWMDYSADGKLIFVRTDDEVFTARAARSFKTIYDVEDIDEVAYAPQVDRILLLESSYKGGVLHLLVASTGEELQRIEFPDLDTEMVALSPDASHALILTSSDSTDDEPKESTPSDLKGYDRYLHRQQNDGYVSTVVSVSLADGAWTTGTTVFRVSFPTHVRMRKDRRAVLGGVGNSAVLSRDGTTDLMNLGDSYIAFGRISDDGATMVTTSGRDIAFHPLNGTATGEATLELEAPKMAGPSERVTAMDEAADGTIYMVTSGYRIWKIAPGAAEVDARAVF